MIITLASVLEKELITAARYAISNMTDHQWGCIALTSLAGRIRVYGGILTMPLLIATAVMSGWGQTRMISRTGSR